MPVELRWANEEHTVLLYDVRGVWTWAEMYASVVQAHQLMNASEQLVHSVVDMSAAGRMGDNPLSHGRRLAGLTHPRSGLTTFVQAPAFMRVLFGTLGRLYPHVNRHTRFVSTREEGLALIQEYEAEPVTLA